MNAGKDELAPLLRALVLLQLSALRDDPEVKPELLLSRAGLSNPEIADLLGKNYAAVAKALSRARKG